MIEGIDFFFPVVGLSIGRIDWVHLFEIFPGFLRSELCCIFKILVSQLFVLLRAAAESIGYSKSVEHHAVYWLPQVIDAFFGLQEIFQSRVIVLHYSEPFLVAYAKIGCWLQFVSALAFGIGVCFFKPVGRFCVILFDFTPAVEMVVAHLPLSARMISESGQFVKIESCVNVLRHADSLVIVQTGIISTLHVAPHGCFGIVSEAGFGIILFGLEIKSVVVAYYRRYFSKRTEISLVDILLDAA